LTQGLTRGSIRFVISFLLRSFAKRDGLPGQARQ
jgi:hypothetical protein